MIPDDVERFIARKFSPADQAEVRRLLDGAVIHDGSAAEPRLLRCAAVASAGSVERLRMEVESLRRDYRDVIVEGEYEPTGAQLVKVRNLNQPIPDEA
jgi:hypothetical protein